MRGFRDLLGGGHFLSITKLQRGLSEYPNLEQLFLKKVLEAQVFRGNVVTLCYIMP